MYHNASQMHLPIYIMYIYNHDSKSFRQLREARAFKTREKRQRRWERARDAAAPFPPTAGVEERPGDAPGQGAVTLLTPTPVPEPDQSPTVLTDEALPDHVARTC